MNAQEQEVFQALNELDAAVKTIRTATPKPDLQALFGRIDKLAAQLPSETDAELLHYLQRKSYEKARAWLEGRKVTAGSCRH